MTASDFLPRVRNLAGLVRDFFYLASVVTPMMILMLYGLYAMNRGWIVSTVRQELGIEALATADSVARIGSQVSSLAEDVRRATGEDRVIRQPQGLSYVEEPVRAGQNVVLWLTVARTRLGKDCRLAEWTPLFVDAQNVPLAGTRLQKGGVRRQISDDFEKLRVEVIPPPSLIPSNQLTSSDSAALKRPVA